jgi:hypothetical protein
MTERAKVLTVALAAAALTGVTSAGASLAGGDGSPRARISFTFDKIEFANLQTGPVRGIVSAAQGKSSSAQVGASLHFSEGAGAGASYRVVGSTQACSKRATAASRVFSVTVTPAAGERDAFKLATASLAKPLAKAGSVRIFALSDGAKPVQKSCGVTVLDNDARLTRPGARAAFALNYQKIDFAVAKSGPYRGIVSAAQGKSRSARVGVSLHGLFSETGGTSAIVGYRVVASTQACSRRATAASRVFSVKVAPAAGQHDAFKLATASLAKPLAKAVSIRIFALSDGAKPVEGSCLVTVTDNEAG